MSLVVDLHSHSLYSDGTLSPKDLVQRAFDKGVNVLALTDHDELAGLGEANEQAEKLGINLINGVEISVSWLNNRTVHIVGLNIDPNNQQLKDGLASIRQERIRRAKKIATRMENCGIPNVWQEIVEEVGFEAITRTHFARYLLSRGHVKDMQQAFKKWLGKKGKAYVSGHWASMEEGVKWIVDAGGQAVIAHPVRYDLTRKKLDCLVAEFKAAGGCGLEVVANRYTRDEVASMASLVRQYELLASVGSDFHSPDNKYVELGQNLDLPANTPAIWHDWAL